MFGSSRGRATTTGRILSAVFLLLGMAVAARAELVVDQQSPPIHDPFSISWGFPIGTRDGNEGQFAQTVTAGIDGRLRRVELAVVCESGALIVEIRNVTSDGKPGTDVLAHAIVDASALPATDEMGFWPVEVAPAVRMAAGDRFAIVLSNVTGYCDSGLTRLEYDGGESFYRREPTDLWLEVGPISDSPVHMAFRTLVDTDDPPRVGGIAQPCAARGFTNGLPIPSFVPLCRCLHDDTLRETRCGFFHPSFFLVRRIPYPILPGEPFAIAWTLMPLEPFEGSIALQDVLPDGFENPPGPLVFYGSGKSLSLEYKAVAPTTSGLFDIGTKVVFSVDQQEQVEGQMTTAINVRKD